VPDPLSEHALVVDARGSLVARAASFQTELLVVTPNEYEQTQRG